MSETLNGGRAAEALTPVDEHLQCADASGEVEGLTEADAAAVHALIETVARIAQSVAARNTRQDQKERTGQ